MNRSFAHCFAVTFILVANWAELAESQQIPEIGNNLTVHVLVCNYAPISTQSLSKGQALASRIFLGVGVEMVWVDQASLRTQTGHHSLKDIDLILRILPQPRATLPSQTALGEALPCQLGRDGCLASVFYSRVRQHVEDPAVPLHTVLGHAIAHELGHLLLGSNSHDETGIMQGKWSRQKLHQAARGHLLFTSEQARSIRMEVVKSLRPKVSVPQS
jgi:hypothetical protein